MHLCQQRITLDSYVVGGSLWPVLNEFFFRNHITVQPGCPDNKHYRQLQLKYYDIIALDQTQ